MNLFYGRIAKSISNGGPVSTQTPEEFEIAGLFPRLGLPSTLIRHEKTLYKPENLKTRALRFRVHGKHFEYGAFRNDGIAR